LSAKKNLIEPRRETLKKATKSPKTVTKDNTKLTSTCNKRKQQTTNIRSISNIIMSDEITVTLTSLENQTTESISVSLNSTKLSELWVGAVALLGLPTWVGIDLTKDGKRLFTNRSAVVTLSSTGSTTSNQTLSSVGIQNGDLLVFVSPSTRNTRSPAAVSSNRNAASSSGGGGGGLDFSSLLGAASVPVTASNNANANANRSRPASSSGKAGTGGLTFNLPPQLPMFQQKTPIQYPGINLDECMAKNPNPQCFIRVLLDPTHPNLLKELNYHSPSLANRLKSAKDIVAATHIWSQHIQKNTMNSTLSKTLSLKKEAEMERKLRVNPMDEEANKYFGDKITKQNVEEQYMRMMEEFPESMGRVLMLYIDTEVNGRDIHAFVDSGAQSTIMSSKCAEKCGLLHLLDTRFEGVAVGVGTGKILGRVHIAEMKVNGHIFPCTITIMDSEKGLGDQNMEFLLGLDMLKRHKCNIDLGRNVLTFSVGNGKMETPFLHEKDLSEGKGGTKGFDAEKSNQEIEKMMARKGDEKDDDEPMKE
jgi:hypothetical protein